MNPNIILILIDALRPINLGCYGYNKNISPNIDKLAKDSIIFKNAFTTINTTDPSLTSIFTGNFPSSHGITSHGVKVKKIQVEKFFKLKEKYLQEILKDYNYKTLAFDFLDRWHKIGFDKYFQKYMPENESKIFSKLRFNKILEYCPPFINKLKLWLRKRLKRVSNFVREDPFYCYKGDENYTNIALREIKNNKKKNSPFFIFIHYWAVHLPYIPPLYCLKNVNISDYKNEPNSSQIYNALKGEWNEVKYFKKALKSTQELLANYDACINFVDHEIGKILELLKQEDLYDKSIIIITADHGESLIEHNIFFDHHGLYDVTIKIPLIIKFPHYSHKEINGFVQSIDIFPTLIDYLKIPTSLPMNGRSMINLIENNKNIRDVIFTEEYYTEKKKSIRTKRVKYIFSESEIDAICKYCGIIHGDSIEELYDLEKDPAENKNIVKEKTEIAKLLRKLLKFELSKILEKDKIGKVINILHDNAKV